MLSRRQFATVIRQSKPIPYGHFINEYLLPILRSYSEDDVLQICHCIPFISTSAMAIMIYRGFRRLIQKVVQDKTLLSKYIILTDIIANTPVEMQRFVVYGNVRVICLSRKTHTYSKR